MTTPITRKSQPSILSSNDLSHSLQNSPFKKCPYEIILFCFSFLLPEQLSSIAQVCKYFKNISETNVIWKPLYFKSWSVGYKWFGQKPMSWKHRTYLLDCFRKELSNQTKSSTCILLWQNGFCNETINLFKKLTMQERAAQLSHGVDFEIKTMHAAIGTDREEVLSKDPDSLDLDAEDLKRAEVHQAWLDILLLLSQRNYDTACNLYIKHRSNFIQFLTLKGWWLSSLFVALKSKSSSKESFPRDKQIFLPKEPGKKLTEAFIGFLTGYCIFWLEQKNYDLSLSAGDCTLDLLERNPISSIDSRIQAMIRALKEALIQVPINQRSSKYHMQLQLLKLDLYCLLHDDQSKNLNFEADIFQLIEVCPNLVGEVIPMFTQLMSVVVYHQQKSLAQKLLDYLRDHPFHREKINLEQEMQLRNAQMNLHFLCQDFKKAEVCLIDLYKIEKAVLRKQASLNGYQPTNDFRSCEFLYELVETDPNFADQLISSYPDCSYSTLAIAYRLFLNRNFDDAMREVIKVIHELDSRDLDWLLDLSQKNLNATLVYSLVIRDPGQLEEFYLDKADQFYNDRCYIFHNLATRLVFEGNLLTALSYIDAAIELDPNEPISHIVKALIHDQLSQAELCSQSIETARKLGAQNIVSPIRKLRQSQLLLYKAEY